MKMTKDEIENLLTMCGVAINSNNGRCPVVEDALIKATTLCVEVLDDMEHDETGVLTT